MKHFYAFLLACASMMSIATAQNVNFPDANFKNALVNSNCAYLGSSTTYTDVDTNNDGEIQLSEAAAVRILQIDNKNISSLVGIQSFSNIQTIYCSDNQLTALDVQGLTSLKFLYCYQNQLSTLDVQGLINLDTLMCYGNQLLTLNIQGLTSLKSLECSHNQLSTLNAQGLTTLNRLNCSYNQLSTLDVQGLTSLNNLDCSGNQLTTLNVQGLTSLTQLSCSSNQLSTLDVQGLTSLNILDCNGNQLSTLDLHGLANLGFILCSNNVLLSLNLQGLTSLTTLDCRENQLLTLDVHESTNLVSLYCHKNQLLSLNVQGLASLAALHCFENLISTLDLQGLTGLTELYCEDNKLLTLNVQGLPSLMFLRCLKNQLTTLNVQGSTSLINLKCDYNNLSTLNAQGMSSLLFLSCSYNQLSTLNVQGLTGLLDINCHNNQLSTLDIQGLTALRSLNIHNNQLSTLGLQGLTNLTDLICYENQLSSLDGQSLTSLKNLYCANNNLTSLFIKNGKNENLAFENNPNLAYICCDTTEIDNINTKITQYGYTNCIINSYCSSGITQHTIQGNNLFDSNNNGCDSSDIAYSFLKFDITDSIHSGIFIADANGNYSIPVQAGTHTITPVLENPSYFFVSPSSVQVSFPASASPFVSNFCITPNGLHQDVEVTILPLTPARPGFDAAYRLLYKNIGNVLVSDSLIFGFEDDKMDFVSATVAPILSGDSLIWTFSNLQPFESRSIDIVLNINSPMEIPPVNAGDVLSFQSIVCPSNNSENGFFSLQQTVVGSYDPNDKTCLEGNEITPDKVGEYLHYLIRFENTGTYFAENIVIKDVIDTTVFDLASLQITESSHNCYMRSVWQNQMEFVFENINLPFTDPGKHGFVAFKIKTKDNLTIGTQLKNQADIFFDYNFPIITNIATTKIVDFKPILPENPPVIVKFLIAPNPATDILLFKAPIKIDKCEIFDHLGRVVQTSSIDKQEVNIAHLPKGLYYVKMYSTNGVALQKFTKM